MRDEAETPVLRRMAGLRSEAAGLAEMTAAKALRNAMAKAGDDVLGTVVGVRDVIQDTLLPETLAEGLPDRALIMRLNGPGVAAGLAVACPQVVAAVIEAQTMGRVLAATAADRRPTPTDAVLVAGFLDAALLGFATLARRCASPPPVAGYTRGPTLADARAAQMLLAVAAHCCFRVELDFGDGAKTGKLVLVYPSGGVAGSAGQEGRDLWQATLKNAVMGTAARMEAVLCRLRLPLADVAQLAVGDSLTLAGVSLDGVSLVGADGATVLTARLGRSGPVRAVRLHLGDAPRRSVDSLSYAAEPPANEAALDAGVVMDVASTGPGAMEPGAMGPNMIEPERQLTDLPTAGDPPHAA